MQIKTLDNYLDKQIALETKYYDAVYPYVASLLTLLNTTIRLPKVTRKYLDMAYRGWWNKHKQKMYYLNALYSLSVYNLVYEILRMQSNIGITTLIKNDMNLGIDNLFNSIYGRYLLAIPVGVALLPQTDYTVANLDELKTASDKSTHLYVQTTISGGVVSILANTAISNGYEEYMGDNEHDDRVRPQHKIDNDGHTWHKFNKLPPSGLPSSETHCRCRVVGLR